MVTRTILLQRQMGKHIRVYKTELNSSSQLSRDVFQWPVNLKNLPGVRLALELKITNVSIKIFNLKIKVKFYYYFTIVVTNGDVQLTN